MRMKKLILLSIILLGTFAVNAQVIKGKFNDYQGETIKINSCSESIKEVQQLQRYFR